MTTGDKIQLGVLALLALSTLGNLVWHIGFNPVAKAVDLLRQSLAKESEKREVEDKVLHKRVTDHEKEPCPKLQAHIDKHPGPSV